MRILFVKPGPKKSLIGYPAQYACLLAMVKSRGHEATFYDALFGKQLPHIAIQNIDFSNIDVVAISVMTGWNSWVKEFVSVLKTAYPDIKVIVGGHHISSLKTVAVEDIGADYGVVGEGELSLAQLLGEMDAPQNVPGVIYKWLGKYVMSRGPLLRVKNMDDLPLPDYDAVKPSRYFDSFLGGTIARKRREIIQIVTSRGCPYHCTFCATNSVWEGKIRFQSPRRVMNEVKLLHDIHGVREFWFGDDGFTAHYDRTVEICDRFIDSGLGFPWRLPNGIRIDTLDDRLAAKMKKAGCYSVGVGIETGSQKIMDSIKKKVDYSQAKEVIGILNRNGIVASGFFILGLPGETLETMQETVNFIMTSNLPRMQICPFMLVPGSESFDVVFKNGGIKEYLENGVCPPIPREVTSDEISKTYRKTILRFYSRPSVMVSMVRHFSVRQIKDIFVRTIWGDGFIKA